MGSYGAIGTGTRWTTPPLYVARPIRIARRIRMHDTTVPDGKTIPPAV